VQPVIQLHDGRLTGLREIGILAVLPRPGWWGTACSLIV